MIRRRKTIGSYSKIASNLNFGNRSWGFIILKSEIASCLTVKIRSTRGDWLYFMKNISKKTRTKIKIASATATAIFSLASAFAGTYAWFSNNTQVNVSGASIKVVAPDLIDYEMYYLSSFTDEESVSHNGNQNPITNFFSGYQLAYEDATFTQVDYLDGEVTNDPDPTNISHLWPAHKLTYAFVITHSKMTKLSISSWGETTGAAEVSDSNPVCLSWAINIYGAAYSVPKTNNISSDVSTGFASYYADLCDYYNNEEGHVLNDVFNYSQALPAPSQKPSISITNSIPENVGETQTIVYFTIEFSNDKSTFYKFNKTSGYYELYVSGETVGFNSNCYEGLSLTGMTIRID